MNDEITTTTTEEESETFPFENEQALIAEEASSAGVDIEEAKSALDELTPTLAAIPAEDVRSLKVGATTAVSIGLAYASAYEEDRPLFEQTFRTEAFDVDAYGDLADRAKAFWQADILLRQELNTEGPVRSLMLEAKPLRAKLVRAANYLWSENSDLSDVVKNISKGVGYANHADDLGRLATLFTEYWAQAEGNCDVTLEDIARAQRLGAEILRAMSPSQSKDIGEMKRLRIRAAEYLRQGIEEVRAAAAYVYRNNDKKLERYPSLFVRKRRKSDRVRVNGEPGHDSVAPTPAATPGTGGSFAGGIPSAGEDLGAITQPA